MDGRDGRQLAAALSALDELLDAAELEIGISELRFEPVEGLVNRAEPRAPPAPLGSLVGMTNGGMLRRPEGLEVSHGLINGFGRESHRPRGRTTGRGLLAAPRLRTRRARRAHEALARMADREVPGADRPFQPTTP